MNSLEKKYLASLERAKARERRREFFLRLLASNFFGTHAITRWLVERLASRRRRPQAVRRERGYRDAWLEQVEPHRSPCDWRAVVQVAILAALAVSAGLGRVAWARQPDDGGWPVLVTVAFTGVIVGAQRLYRAWRARRNARLVLEWERRLDSNGRR